ncbi:hypothetical protein [Polluticaenibacter yanchengensis]|uniref:Lipoprotein n=1 Tax=Polluticaenibacter yanchengensis TaxID=3014562 RepID=A0ABT4UFP6_9BACT|nr:hypothetical protein [Chitinophagaceae bacterium LY-5]
MKGFLPHTILFGTMLSLYACSGPAQLSLDKTNWNTYDNYTVKKTHKLFKGEKLIFGEFATEDFKRSWTKNSGHSYGIGSGIVTDYDYTNLITWSKLTSRQKMSFVLTNEKQTEFAEVFGLTEVKSDQIEVGRNPNTIFNIGLDIVTNLLKTPSNILYTQIYTGRQAPYELLLDDTQANMHRKKYYGVMARNDRDYYIIKPMYQLNNKKNEATVIPFGVIGYEFFNVHDEPVAAVSLLGQGSVYLNTSDSKERILLAAACSAILLKGDL